MPFLIYEDIFKELAVGGLKNHHSHPFFHLHVTHVARTDRNKFYAKENCRQIRKHLHQIKQIEYQVVKRNS